MNPEEYARVQQLFLLLREMSPEEQNQRLAAIENDSSEKRLEDPPGAISMLKQLLLASATEESLFDTPIARLPHEGAGSSSELGTEDFQIESQETPNSIGPYRILQKIGEGGHGLVFMAEQRVPIQRRVAIKLIKPGMESKAILARFEAERQALALMRHPSIANVIDAGTSNSGSPYFVMELVHGIPIDTFCAENKLTLH